jgi:hypothetical protein
MIFDLTTNEHYPLLGTIRAILCLCKGGLEAENFILDFASDEIDTLLRLGFYRVDTSVSFHLDALDARIGLILDLFVSASRLSQLVL